MLFENNQKSFLASNYKLKNSAKKFLVALDSLGMQFKPFHHANGGARVKGMNGLK